MRLAEAVALPFLSVLLLCPGRSCLKGQSWMVMAQEGPSRLQRARVPQWICASNPLTVMQTLTRRHRSSLDMRGGCWREQGRGQAAPSPVSRGSLILGVSPAHLGCRWGVRLTCPSLPSEGWGYTLPLLSMNGQTVFSPRSSPWPPELGC